MENMDKIKARTERVIFGLFKSNSDFTWPDQTLKSPIITQQIWALNSNIELLFLDIEKYVRIFGLKSYSVNQQGQKSPKSMHVLLQKSLKLSEYIWKLD